VICNFTISLGCHIIIIAFFTLQYHAPDITELLKENIFYPQPSEENGLDVKVSSSNDTSSKVLQAEDLSHASPMSCHSSSRSQLQNVGSRYNRMSLQQPTPDMLRIVEEVVITPDTTNKLKTTRSSNPSASGSRGSHIRKSLQTIGKLINGSERR